jgi:hypothetical protein
LEFCVLQLLWDIEFRSLCEDGGWIQTKSVDFIQARGGGMMSLCEIAVADFFGDFDGLVGCAWLGNWARWIG